MLVSPLCSTVVYAGQSASTISHKLDNLTQDDGIVALKAGDALGFEVLSRAELESVRGEIIPIVYYYSVVYGVPYSVALATYASKMNAPMFSVAWHTYKALKE